MTTDRLKGKGKDIVGTAKEKVGRATGNEDLEAEGTVEKGEGKVQDVVGRAKNKVASIKRKVS